MAWITPKTNWTENSYFNASDYNRIKGNINEVWTLLGDSRIPLDPMGVDKTIGSLFYADEVNKFWENTDYICTALGIDFSGYPIFAPNSRIMFAAELNRLEAMIERAYLAIVGNIPVYAIDANGEYARSNNNRAKARPTNG